MKFEKGHLYHVYNQGNNREVVYYDRQNYLLFIRKIREYLIPYVDILAWCLMPNHFHLMVFVKSTQIEPVIEGNTSEGSQNIARTLNNSIAIMLRSYSNIINKKHNRVGSLFRPKTKAACLDPVNGYMPSWYTLSGLTKINYQFAENQYPQICFNYIHNNPVVSGLAIDISSWEFSSASEILGLRRSKLVNKKRIAEFGFKLSLYSYPKY